MEIDSFRIKPDYVIFVSDSQHRDLQHLYLLGFAEYQFTQFAVVYKMLGFEHADLSVAVYDPTTSPTSMVSDS